MVPLSNSEITKEFLFTLIKNKIEDGQVVNIWSLDFLNGTNCDWQRWPHCQMTVRVRRPTDEALIVFPKKWNESKERKSASRDDDCLPLLAGLILVAEEVVRSSLLLLIDPSVLGRWPTQYALALHASSLHLLSRYPSIYHFYYVSR